MNRRDVGIVLIAILSVIAAEEIIWLLCSKNILKHTREINIPLCAEGCEYEDSPHLFAIVKRAYDGYLEEHRELPGDLSFLPEYIRKRIKKRDSALWYNEEDGILYYCRAVEPLFMYKLVVLQCPSVRCPAWGEVGVGLERLTLCRGG